MKIDFPEATLLFEPLDLSLKRKRRARARGLCSGVGSSDGQMCIEAAITQALGLPFNDEPECVAESVRRYKITLNDSSRWKSPQSRAETLRAIGIAQIGSKGVVDDVEFAKRLAEKTIRVLIPMLFRERFPKNAACLAAADRCEKEGTEEAAIEARKVAAAAAANAAAKKASDPEKYLRLSASLALEVLRELKSPGCEYV